MVSMEEVIKKLAAVDPDASIDTYKCVQCGCPHYTLNIEPFSVRCDSIDDLMREIESIAEERANAA